LSRHKGSLTAQSKERITQMSDVRERSLANFSERRQHEVRRIYLPRTSVNKGKKEGRGY
jgi:hypothetical protein